MEKRRAINSIAPLRPELEFESSRLSAALAAMIAFFQSIAKRPVVTNQTGGFFRRPFRAKTHGRPIPIFIPDRRKRSGTRRKMDPSGPDHRNGANCPSSNTRRNSSTSGFFIIRMAWKTFLSGPDPAAFHLPRTMPPARASARRAGFTEMRTTGSLTFTAGASPSAALFSSRHTANGTRPPGNRASGEIRARPDWGDRDRPRM